MSRPQHKLLDLVAQGKIDPADADTLLQAMDTAKPRWWHRLLDPLELGTVRGWILTLVGVAATLVVTTNGVRFDGVLDTHIAELGADATYQAQWLRSGVELSLGWPLLALVLFVGARLVSRRGRFVDSLLLVGVARLPIIFGGIVTAVLLHLRSDPLEGPTALGIVTILVPLLCWSTAMLVRGFGTISGVRETKSIVVALGLLVTTEIASKAVLMSLGW